METSTAKEFLNKEVIEAGAEWWTQSLNSPQKDNGSNDESSNFAAAIGLFYGIKDRPSTKQLASFKSALIEGIEKSEGHYRGAGYCILRVDYHPEDELASAAKVAGISDNCFSWKTTMWIYPDYIQVKVGYGAPIQVIYGVKPDSE